MAAPHNPHNPRKPTFLWQGIMIVLPVAVLAVVGVIQLRKDREEAEREARRAAEICVRQVQVAVGDSLPDKLESYRLASLHLNNVRKASLGLIQYNSSASMEAERRSYLSWQADHADIDLTAMPPCAIRSCVDPGQCWPPPLLVPPEPSPWQNLLSTEQRRIWQAIEASLDTNECAALIKQFYATPLPRDAWMNARLQLLGLEVEALDPSTICRHTRTTGLSFDEHTSAGFPIGQVAGLRALVKLPGSAGIQPDVESWLSQLVFYSPSLLSEVVLQQVRRVAGVSNVEFVQGLEQQWRSDQTARAIRNELLAALPSSGLDQTLRWVNTGGESWLVASAQVGEFSGRVSGKEAAGPIYEHLTFPSALVGRTLESALTQKAIELPVYARVSIELAGACIDVRTGEIFPVERSPVLAEYADAGLTLSSAASRNFPFIVRASLVDADLLLARHRHRFWLMMSLVFCSVVAATVGLVAARRAFHYQLGLNEQKSNFVSSVSHELRAPIASVRLMAESLERGNVVEPAKQREYFHFIGQECRRLSALIANVLDFARIEQGRKQYEFEPTDLRKLVEATVKLMEPYAMEKGVKLELNAERGTRNAELNVDGRAIQQALVNLIDNSIKHSASGQAVMVSLETRNAERGTRNEAPGTCNLQRATFNLSVSDRGPGIPASEREKIFERFYRLGSELRRETQGVGIGLSIVKHIVEAHDGRVIVESEVGQGSKFTIELPGKTSTTDGHG
jgi:signal transduction histidine kinase